MEEYLRWLPDCPSKHTGEPLAVITVKHEVNAIGAFCRDTAIWGWTDVPRRPLISSRDTPRRPETLPRYLTTQEVDALMGAVEDLTDPLQRAALLLLRWSWARRDEIRRLTIDCLDHYPDGHPRLKIEYTPRLRARLDREDQLIADGQQRGWQREVERHRATKRRLEQLLHDLA